MSRRGTVDEMRHSRTLWSLPECVEVLARVTAHLVRREASALGFRRIEGVAQRVQLGQLDGVPDGVLRGRKGSGGNLGLHPLCGIGRELDFQSLLLKLARRLAHGAPDF